MMALIVGVVVGFLMCIPVGPINVWVVNTLIKHNFKSAFSIALGGSLMDFVYFMVILSGLSFIHFNPQTIMTLKIVGVLFLFVFGMKELLVNSQKFELSDDEIKKAPHPSSFFLLGVLIYTSNPTLIATLSALAAVIKSWQLFQLGFLNYFFLSAGIAVGSASWFYFLLKVVQKYQNKIPEKAFILFNRLCGVLIVLFSLYMAFNVYKENFV